MEPLSFLEAIEWARNRTVILPGPYYSELQGLARSMAFSVAGLTKLDQLQAVMDSLADATATGETFADWKKRATNPAGNIRLELPAHRIENIFRTNLQGHYARGRAEQQRAAQRAFPYLMYDAINDSRTRPSHAALDGMVARQDDPRWHTFRVPNGYQCRCRTIALSERQAARFIEADARRMLNPEAATARQQARPDPGWDYDILAEPTEGLRRAIAQKARRIHPRFADILNGMQASANRPASPIPLRAPWSERFPLADIHAPESSVKKHPAYAAAKSGDAGASLELVKSLTDGALIESLAAYRKQSPALLPVHGIEGASVNTIPLAMAVHLSEQLGYELATDVIQTSKAGHTGSSGWWRLVSPALFSGQIALGKSYILLDDFIGMGGTFANLRGYIEANGGSVIHAQALTGKPHSSKLALQHDTLTALRDRYGHEFEIWWIVQFGYGLDALTESEALYLLRAGDVDTIRRRLAEATLERDG